MSSEILSQVSTVLRERLDAHVSIRHDGQGLGAIEVRCELPVTTTIQHVPIEPDRTFYSHEKIGSVLHVTTTLPSRSASWPPSFNKVSRRAVFASFCRSERDQAVAFSRIPVFLDTVVRDAAFELVTGVVAYQAPILSLVGSRSAERVQRVLSNLRSTGYSGRQITEIYGLAASNLQSCGYVVELLRDGVIVLRSDSDARDLADTPRIECRFGEHPLVGECLRMELIFPMAGMATPTRLSQIALELARTEFTATDHSFGVGAWLVDGRHRSLKYRIWMPTRPEWRFPAEALVQSLTLRWQILNARCGLPALDFNPDCRPAPLGVESARHGSRANHLDATSTAAYTQAGIPGKTTIH
jgi:hypothetical protein